MGGCAYAMLFYMKDLGNHRLWCLPNQSLRDTEGQPYVDSVCKLSKKVQPESLTTLINQSLAYLLQTKWFQITPRTKCHKMLPTCLPSFELLQST